LQYLWRRYLRVRLYLCLHVHLRQYMRGLERRHVWLDMCLLLAAHVQCDVQFLRNVLRYRVRPNL
jgi:hypothetical protein